jgi:hypothetical protein
LGEVLTPGREGVVFRDPGELTTVLLALARADLTSVPAFASARTWLMANPVERWEEQWTRVAGPVLGAATPSALVQSS